MAEIEVWTKRHLGRGVEAKRIWKGELPAVPRIGESICLSGDWALETVLDVQYDLTDKTVTIQIGPDYTNEYPEHPG